MAKKIGEGTEVTVDLKTMGTIIGGAVSLAAMWFALQADIKEAKELPEPTIDRIEYDLKDELIRQTILDTQKDVDMILKKIEKLDEKLYDISKR